MGPQIWNNVPQDIYTVTSSYYVTLTSLITGTCMGGGGGWAASSIQWHPYIYNVYIVCSTMVVSHSSCRLASTSIISKQIKLLFHKTSNYALPSQILFSTYLKVHVYHIMELFIYAFKFQFIVKM